MSDEPTEDELDVALAQLRTVRRQLPGLWHLTFAGSTMQFRSIEFSSNGRCVITALPRPNRFLDVLALSENYWGQWNVTLAPNPELVRVSIMRTGRQWTRKIGRLAEAVSEFAHAGIDLYEDEYDLRRTGPAAFSATSVRTLSGTEFVMRRIR